MNWGIQKMRNIIRCNHPVPIKYRYKYRGALKDPDDPRDVKYRKVCGTPPIEMPSWDAGYDVEEKYGRMKVENQQSSSSCVSQGVQYYVQILNWIEEGKFVDLSARFIYSQIFLPQGGAYIRSGIGLVTDKGIPEENLCPSYKPDGTTDENWMRDKGWESDKTYENALIRKAKTYASIVHDEPDLFELARQAIYQSHGLVSGFKNHCVYFKGFGIKNLKKFLRYKNSWGETWGPDKNGDGYLFEDQANQLYSLWTLLDQSNIYPQTKMYKLVRSPIRNHEVFAINSKIKRHVANAQTLELGNMEPDRQWIIPEVVPIATEQEWSVPTGPEVHYDPVEI